MRPKSCNKNTQFFSFFQSSTIHVEQNQKNPLYLHSIRIARFVLENNNVFVFQITFVCQSWRDRQNRLGHSRHRLTVLCETVCILLGAQNVAGLFSFVKRKWRLRSVISSLFFNRSCGMFLLANSTEPFKVKAAKRKSLTCFKNR